ncbi:1-acyl-sn-glycerol-3-phosphate acyltransferase [Ulvibacter litoralis]|uniref:SSD domain-containing protein n=1 Tax=Ulvibacter litoralis TaxID=227084 RepID=A0A1G7DTN0_9FLAO|nr:1-acyl-sn-glycerol-3-phosphate acyltransferase [Ulvibacter litoralis]GHC42348.1 glycerol acyltransferase [Ulvibacter litoralis]SDE54843.1 hypothetical protein SAMN05421855_1011163 [Ulvibacter litoralis]
MNKLFYNAYTFIEKNSIASLGALLVVIAFLGFLASKIEFEEDITKLIPTNSKTQEVQKVLASVNFTDKIIVNIQRQPNGTLEDLTNYASVLVDSLQKEIPTHIKNIQGIVKEDAIDSTLDFLYYNAPIFLEDTDYRKIEAKLQKDSIAAITEANYKMLLSPSGIIAKKTIRRDPLGISFLALQKLQQIGLNDQFTLKNGFLVSKDEQNVLLFITPTFPSSETAQNALFADRLYEIQKKVNTAFSEKVESEYFGAALIAVANAQQIKKDIQFTVGIALSVLVLIFILFYRKLTIPLILFTPTLFGGLLSVAVLYLVRGQISAISLGIGSVLLGVTLDYSLHILTHIRNNETIKSLYKDITLPILMSSLTTALAFLCLLFLDSQALQDLGIFAAVSVIGASVFALLFIPQVYKGGTSKKRKNTLLDRIASYQFHQNKWLVGGIALLVLVSAFTYNNVVFNKDISKLNFEPPAATAAKEHLETLTNIDLKSMYLVGFGKTTEEALAANDVIFEKLQLLKERNEITSYNSIGAILFSEGIQQQKIAQWKQFWNPETFQKTQTNLIESGATFGFKPTTFKQFYTLLESDFEPLQVSDYSAITSFSIDDFVTEKDDFTTVTSLVKVGESTSEKVKETFKDLPNTLLIDRQAMNETLLGNLKNDFNDLIGYSLLVVLILLLLFFRSFSLTLVTAIPIFLTWVITIGVMGLFGLEFNIFNIIISTFIFGLGIDYSIFVTNGMLKENETGEKTLATHKTSIILSVITTILGVGVLIFAKHPALYSISVVSIIGIFAAMLVSFTIQPLLFKLFIGSKTKRPISLRLLLHSVGSFLYYGLGGLCLSIFSVLLMPLIPLSKKVKMLGFHKVISKFMKSVLYTNPFVKKRIVNVGNETFEKPGIIIANHTSFLDILAIGMLHPKIIFLVNDWVYNSPIFGKAVQLAGFYPVSNGIDNGVEHLQVKVAQGYSLMAFPEGTRSTTNKVRRFHKGAFFLAEKLSLDIIPVLIHGNSEVLPKGSFVIRNGSITVKILDRITSGNDTFGTTYKDRTKRISAYFRTELEALRNDIEGETYFHDLIKLEYRYKGDALYAWVKNDLKANAAVYKTVMDTLPKNASIVNLSENKGVLDFLLMLDSTDRKICTYIEDEEVRVIVENSFITEHYKRLTFAASEKEALDFPGHFYILNASESATALLNDVKKSSDLDFQIVFQNHKLSIFKKTEE